MWVLIPEKILFQLSEILVKYVKDIRSKMCDKNCTISKLSTPVSDFNDMSTLIAINQLKFR